MYDFEVEHVAEEIIKRGARRVLLQLPDGLRSMALWLVRSLSGITDAEILLSGDSCYGACDIALSPAGILGADLLVHYGHSKMIDETIIPVLYIEAAVDFDVEPLTERVLPLVTGWDKIGLSATVQHVHKLGEVAESLRRLGVNPVIAAGGGKTPHDGQILGCDYHTAQSIVDEVDGYVFVGGGRFHPLGLAMTTGKQVVVANPYIMSVEILDEKKVMQIAMQRMAAITAAKDANQFGVIVSLKPGQLQLATARSLRNRLEQNKKEAAIICLDEVSNAKLRNFSEVEAFISTACPRIALDGIADIRKPLLTVVEAQIMLGEKRWEDVWGRSYFG